jgi:hypothetical protein
VKSITNPTIVMVLMKSSTFSFSVLIQASKDNENKAGTLFHSLQISNPPWLRTGGMLILNILQNVFICYIRINLAQP